MPRLFIRRVRKKDLPEVYSIEELSFKRPYPHSLIDSFSSLNPETFLIAERNGRIVGYVIGSIRSRNSGHILSIAVHPSERQNGVGRTLVIRMLEILREKGVATVRLEVRRSNTATHRFYETLRFEYAYTIHGYYGDEDALVYFRTL